jgi:hypothetical protein
MPPEEIPVSSDEQTQIYGDGSKLLMRVRLGLVFLAKADMKM